MDIDLKLLQHAVVLAKHRHFGRAASSLRVSQPTLSRNIAALEKALGVRVFERSRTDIAATPAGADVLKMAEELVGRAAAISNRLEQVRDGHSGHLRVVASTYICDMAVYPALSDLLNNDPPMSIEVIEREWSGTIELVMNDQADFAVLDVTPLAKAPACASTSPASSRSSSSAGRPSAAVEVQGAGQRHRRLPAGLHAQAARLALRHRGIRHLLNDRSADRQPDAAGRRLFLPGHVPDRRPHRPLRWRIPAR